MSADERPIKVRGCEIRGNVPASNPIKPGMRAIDRLAKLVADAEQAYCHGRRLSGPVSGIQQRLRARAMA